MTNIGHYVIEHQRKPGLAGELGFGSIGRLFNALRTENYALIPVELNSSRFAIECSPPLLEDHLRLIQAGNYTVEKILPQAFERYRGQRAVKPFRTYLGPDGGR